MDFDSIIAWVEGIAESLSQYIVAIANALYNIIVDVWNALVSLIEGIWNWLGTIWSTLKDFFDDLWWEVIVPFIEWCQEIIDDITTWLANFLDPLITFIQQLQALLKFWMQIFFQPLLEIIQRLRVILGLLKLLGFKWAAKLDADLQILQSWITAIVQEITATLNTISTVIGLMVDPTGILRRDFFAGTLFSSLGAVAAAGSAGTDRVSLPSENAQVAQAQALGTSTTPFATLNADGSLTYLPGAAAINSQVQARYAAVGAPTLGN